MPTDKLLHHKVEGHVDTLVEEVEELVIKVAEEMAEVQTRGQEAAVGMIWEDFKSLMKEEYFPSNEMQKLETEFWSHATVEAEHSTYTDRFYELARLIPHLVSFETKRMERYIYGLALQIREMVAATKPPTLKNVILKAEVLTDELVRNGSLKKSGEKRGNGRKPSKEGNVKGDNKRVRTGKVFATITNPVRKEYTGSEPKFTNYNFYHYPETPCCACTIYNCLGHFAKDYRAGPKMVNPLNARNPKATRGVCYKYGVLITISQHALGEISSGSTTTHSDISLPDYEAFYFDDDHIKEISSGNTTTHSDISFPEYDSFIFDLTHEEFVDELAHIISPPEYDCFYFRDLPDPGELMSVLNSGIRENLSTTLVNLPIEDDYSPLLAYVVWIFVAYLTYPVIPPYLHPFGNEDTIFDPGITINHFNSFKPGSSHRHGAFKKFNTHRSHLNEWPMIINGKNTPLLDVLLFHFYPP
nr:reverse transcriptase domain-containing protein [Tanacetum cinerariifolium]